ncbi:MAG: hypothetical protein C0508_20455 [Cyanobacteria bacterium PR.023]|nr:hypothetical protein [Cyanobacteria bacterium PR.023]
MLLLTALNQAESHQINLNAFGKESQCQLLTELATNYSTGVLHVGADRDKTVWVWLGKGVRMPEEE